MSKHTPGPWVLDGEAWVVTVATKRYITCEGRNAEEAEANARLIAAAPEMLEALQEAYRVLSLRNLDCDVKALTIARAALTKAEGETNV